MGYTCGELRIYLRAERHNGPGDVADDRAIEELKEEIEELISKREDYERVAPLGVSGGV